MPKQLYNEGRVVGYSAYEAYVKHALSEFPNQEPASEREWLASTLANGSSLVLHVPKELYEYTSSVGIDDTSILPSEGKPGKVYAVKYWPNYLEGEPEYGYYIWDVNTQAYVPGGTEITYPHPVDIPLPENSNLVAANVIIGSFFFGNTNAHGDNEYEPWGTFVENYSQALLPNYAQSISGEPASWYCPGEDIDGVLIEDARDYPYNPEEIRYFIYGDIAEYAKIRQGVVLQPGTWNFSEHYTEYDSYISSIHPAKDLSPEFNDQPVVRLLLNSAITADDLYILLTGFSDKRVISGISGLDGSNTEIHPENGDFLGPALFPWASPIIFTTPTVTIESLVRSMYSTRPNLSIEVLDNFTVRFTVSRLNAKEGTCIVAPQSPAASDIDIYSITETIPYLYDENHDRFVDDHHPYRVNYLDIHQSGHNYTSDLPAGNVLGTTDGAAGDRIGSTEADNGITTSTITDKTSTYLSPSPVVAGEGVATKQPTSPGEPVIVNSMVASGSKYLKVERIAKQNIGNNIDAVTETEQLDGVSQADFESRNYGYTTLITPSPIEAAIGGGVEVIEPTNPGDAIQLLVNIVGRSSTSGTLWDVINVGTSGGTSGTQKVLKLDATALLNALMDSKDFREKVIFPLIQGGAGISVSQSGNVLKISNSALSGNWKRLVEGTDYNFGWPNPSTAYGFFAAPGSNEASSYGGSSITLSSIRNTYGGLRVDAQGSGTSGYSIRIRNGENSKGKSVALKFKGPLYDKSKSGDARFNFQFRHSVSYAGTDGRPNSKIFAITFKNNYAFLNNKNLVHTDYGVGIWNVARGTSMGKNNMSPYGGSFEVNCSIQKRSAVAGDTVTSGFMCSATSIADGYNSQYNAVAGNSYNVYCYSWLNFDTTFYLI